MSEDPLTAEEALTLIYRYWNSPKKHERAHAYKRAMKVLSKSSLSPGIVFAPFYKPTKLDNTFEQTNLFMVPPVKGNILARNIMANSDATIDLPERPEYARLIYECQINMVYGALFGVDATVRWRASKYGDYLPHEVPVQAIEWIKEYDGIECPAIDPSSKENSMKLHKKLMIQAVLHQFVNIPDAIQGNTLMPWPRARPDFKTGVDLIHRDRTTNPAMRASCGVFNMNNKYMDLRLWVLRKIVIHIVWTSGTEKFHKVGSLIYNKKKHLEGGEIKLKTWPEAREPPTEGSIRSEAASETVYASGKLMTGELIVHNCFGDTKVPDEWEASAQFVFLNQGGLGTPNDIVYTEQMADPSSTNDRKLFYMCLFCCNESPKRSSAPGGSNK